MDRRLIGLLVEREVESRMNWTDFAEHSGVSRATLHRVKVGDPRVTQRVFRQIERALDLPFDALTAVGVHDWISLEDDGTTQEMITWLKRGAGTTSSAGSASSTSTKSSQRGSAADGEPRPD